MEEDLGTRLDWVAVDHFDTAHPHTHIIARGVTHDGKGLNIAGEYISRGIRGRLEEELTRELGWKSEIEIQQEMKREVSAKRVTKADRHIANGMDKLNNTIDLRAGSVASTFPANSSMNRHILIGRMKHLERMGLAQSKYDGLWRVEKDAFKTLGRDEGMNPDAKGRGKVRFIIDGTDGYVSTVETGMDTRAGEAAKVGSIIEVSPPNLRTVDRNIQALATGKDYHGKPRNGLVGHYAIATSGPDDWMDGSGSRGAAHMRAHRLRLATLVKAGVVQVASKDKDGDPNEARPTLRSKRDG